MHVVAPVHTSVYAAARIPAPQYDHVEKLIVERSEHEKNYQRARSWKTYWQSENIIPSKKHFDGKIKDTKALAVEAAKRYNLLPGVI